MSASSCAIITGVCATRFDIEVIDINAQDYSFAKINAPRSFVYRGRRRLAV